MDEAITNIIGRFATPAINDGDYINDEGLTVCGKCGETKQFYGEFLGEILKLNCPCKCDREREEQRKEQQWRERIAYARKEAFPPNSNYIDARFEYADESAAISAAKKYVEHFETDFKPDGTGLLLYGTFGTGKTYAAACVCNAIIDMGYRALFTTIPRIINKLQSAFDGRQEFIDYISNVPLLVIDDLCAERNTEFARETVFEVINGRNEAKKPLIVTTNITIDELKGKGADMTTARVYSRLLEMCVPIEVAGSDRRRGNCRVNYEKAKSLLNI